LGKKHQAKLELEQDADFVTQERLKYGGKKCQGQAKPSKLYYTAIQTLITRLMKKEKQLS